LGEGEGTVINNEMWLKSLENLPVPGPFTDEEWDDLMQQIANDR